MPPRGQLGRRGMGSAQHLSVSWGRVRRVPTCSGGQTVLIPPQLHLVMPRGRLIMDHSGRIYTREHGTCYKLGWFFFFFFPGELVVKYLKMYSVVTVNKTKRQKLLAAIPFVAGARTTTSLTHPCRPLLHQGAYGFI